jgi:hypothetical protein
MLIMVRRICGAAACPSIRPAHPPRRERGQGCTGAAFPCRAASRDPYTGYLYIPSSFLALLPGGKVSDMNYSREAVAVNSRPACRS